MDSEERISALLAQLTLKEKAALLSGRDVWNTVAIQRLGMPSIVMTDGPHGVRACNPEVGRKIGPTTAFPTGISMAAAWNPELIEQVGQALGEETRGMGCDVLLGPCINIARYPLGGRSFESYSEDPFLAGRTAVAYVQGVQSRGVGTSLKHYALNNYEIERFRASARVDERTMREIYLAAFEMAVKEAAPWTVMCSYNRVNGVYASEHAYLLRTILKEEWGFDGAVVSDWGAVHSLAAPIQNGLDLEMPGPVKYFRLLREAVENWQVTEEAVDEAARRILRLVERVRRPGAPSGAVNTPEHQALARTLAEEAITLLKNDGGLLPLDLGQVKTIAVVGPNADAVIEGGGSSRVDPPYRVAPLEALRRQVGERVQIEFERGCDNYDEPFDVPRAWLEPTGLRGSFYVRPDFAGEPAFTRSGFWSDYWFNTAWSGLPKRPVAARWEGALCVPDTADYHLRVTHTGMVRVYIDGSVVLESTAPDTAEGESVARGQRLMEGAQPVQLRIELVCHPGQEVMKYQLALGTEFAPGEDPRPARAAALARRADLVLYFGGMPEGYETEGNDRPHMRLPGGQDGLIAALAAANPKTVVVLNNGSPVEMPWVDQVAAIVEAYYPGQENGNAVTRVLLGEVNPSGKLPVTFPRRLQDSPAFVNAAYPGAREVNYGEGIFVGYRYFDQVEREPLFAFGHGLSYTTFDYGELQVPEAVTAGEPVRVSVKVSNCGRVAGKEVVQLYVGDPVASLPRSPKELKGFAKVGLAPGASTRVEFVLDERALAFYDPRRQRWIAEPGGYTVMIGSSSRDIRVTGAFTLV